MAQFSVDAVEMLEYDFTGIPSDKNPKVYCSGKGVIPEPTHKGLKTYQDSIRELFGFDKDEEADVEKAIEKKQKEESEEELEAKTEKLIELTADLCQQSPSTDQLLNLPPRYRMAFMSWIQKELSNPEA